MLQFTSTSRLSSLTISSLFSYTNYVFNNERERAFEIHVNDLYRQIVSRLLSAYIRTPHQHDELRSSLQMCFRCAPHYVHHDSTCCWYRSLNEMRRNEGAVPFILCRALHAGRTALRLLLLLLFILFLFNCSHTNLVHPTRPLLSLFYFYFFIILYYILIFIY